MKPEDLKPCPWCGKERTVIGRGSGLRTKVKCLECDADGPVAFGYEEDAIAAWNTRQDERQRLSAPLGDEGLREKVADTIWAHIDEADRQDCLAAADAVLALISSDRQALSAQVEELEADLREVQIASEMARRDRDRAEAQVATLQAELDALRGEARSVVEPFAKVWAEGMTVTVRGEATVADVVAIARDRLSSAHLKAAAAFLERLPSTGKEVGR
jgi:Lar family restriction alleviation protein